jgi:hypothetical protein
MPKPLTVANFGTLGRIIKEWAKGERPVPAENDLTEFMKVLNDNGVGPELDPGITKLRFVTHDSDTLIIRLPPRDMLTEHEARLATEDYVLPAFFGTVSAPGAQEGAVYPVKLAFDDERIGDYTIANCA